jgi:hypothetical protein
MIATTSGRLASQGGSGVMNGVTALSIRKIASAASAMRCASASRALGVPSPACWVVTCMTQVATSAAERANTDVIAERLITVSIAAMTSCSAYCDNEILDPSQTSVANVPPKQSAIAITAAFMTPSAISRHHRR